MKKKSALFIIIILILSLVSCTSIQLELWSKIKDIQYWEATTSNLKGTLELSMSSTISEGPVVTNFNERCMIDFNSKVYLNVKDSQSYFEIQMIDKTNTLSIPTMKIYIDKTNFYIDKDSFIYFMSLYDYNDSYIYNQSIDTPYIRITLEENIFDRPAGYSNYIKDINTLYKEIAEKVGFDIPVEKQNNLYTISMDENSIIDLFIKVCDTTISNLDNLDKTFNLNSTEEEIENIKTDYANYREEFVTTLNQELKPLIKDSKLKVTYDFKDNETVNQNISINLPITIPTSNPNENSISALLNINISNETIKSEAKPLELPKDFIEIYDYYNNLSNDYI